MPNRIKALFSILIGTLFNITIDIIFLRVRFSLVSSFVAYQCKHVAFKLFYLVIFITSLKIPAYLLRRSIKFSSTVPHKKQEKKRLLNLPENEKTKPQQTELLRDIPDRPPNCNFTYETCYMVRKDSTFF